MFDGCNQKLLGKIQLAVVDGLYEHNIKTALLEELSGMYW
jgi:hypothetical protein